MPRKVQDLRKIQYQHSGQNCYRYYNVYGWPSVDVAMYVCTYNYCHYYMHDIPLCLHSCNILYVIVYNMVLVWL